MSGSFNGKAGYIREKANVPEDVEVLDGFINMSSAEIEEFKNKMGFAMSLEDLKFCQEYFKNTEKETQP